MPEKISRSSRCDWPLRCFEDEANLNHQQWHRDASDIISAYPNASITTVPEKISRSSRCDWPLRCFEDEVKLNHQQWHRDAPDIITAYPNANITTAPEKISRSSRRDWPLRCLEDEVKLNRQQWHRDVPNNIPAYPNASITRCRRRSPEAVGVTGLCAALRMRQSSIISSGTAMLQTSSLHIRMRASPRHRRRSPEAVT